MGQVTLLPNLWGWALVLVMVGCTGTKTLDSVETGAVLDTSVPPDLLDALDTAGGRYHLELSFDPAPPVVGETALTVLATLNSSHPDLGDAALVGANLTLTGQLFGSETDLGDPVIAEEESLGTYVARFTWPTSGLWALLIDVGAAEASEQALVGVQVASQ